MVDELIDRGLWDCPKFRAIARNNARARPIESGYATIATPITIPTGKSRSSLSADDDESFPLPLPPPPPRGPPPYHHPDQMDVQI